MSRQRAFGRSARQSVSTPFTRRLKAPRQRSSILGGSTGPADRFADGAGTFAGVVPVRRVDGRTIGTGARGPLVERLQGLYAEHVEADVAGRTVP